MKSFLIKFAILAGCFFATAFITSKIINKDSVDLTSELSEATLPVVYMLDDTDKMNIMYGYTADMDATSMRGYICLTDDSHTLSFKVDTYGREIDGIEYEIRSLDASRLIENGEPEISESTSDSMTISLSTGNLLSKGSQYMFILSLISGEQSIQYYARPTTISMRTSARPSLSTSTKRAWTRAHSTSCPHIWSRTTPRTIHP